MQRQTEQNRQRVWEMLAAAGLVVLLHLAFMALTGQGFSSPNPYNSYSKQAVAWLSGRLDLGQNYSWLELAIFEGKYYVSFPPFPSMVLLPFALFMGEQTPDTLLSLLIAAAGAACAARICGEYCKNSLYTVMLPVFLYCGTAVWQITINGWVWFFAQNLALTLTLGSILAAMKNYRGLALFLLVAAVGCRPFNIAAFPVILYILYTNRRESTFLDRWKWLLIERFRVWLPAVALAVVFMALNWVRFGSVFEFGRKYLPEFTEAPEGQFSRVYFMQNLPKLFRLPQRDPSTGALDFPMFNGMNIFLAFPILIWLLWLLGRAMLALCNRERRAWARTALWQNGALLVLCGVQIAGFLLHRTMGGFHYGNRYVGDVLPLVFLGLCILSGEKKAPAFEPQPGGRALVSELLFWGLFGCGLMFSVQGVMRTL